MSSNLLSHSGRISPSRDYKKYTDRTDFPLVEPFCVVDITFVAGLPGRATAFQPSSRAASSFAASSSIECAAIGFHARNKLYRTPRIAAFIVDGL
jgi:hypothetical protein